MPKEQHQWYKEPATPKQQFARRRNWEKRQLMGIISNLYRLETLSSAEGSLVEVTIRHLQIVIEDWENFTTVAKKVSKLGKRLKLI